jgi:hypothetical protein
MGGSSAVLTSGYGTLAEHELGSRSRDQLLEPVEPPALVRRLGGVAIISNSSDILLGLSREECDDAES